MDDVVSLIYEALSNPSYKGKNCAWSVFFFTVFDNHIEVTEFLNINYQELSMELHLTLFV